jgi:hypothetical protein
VIRSENTAESSLDKDCEELRQLSINMDVPGLITKMKEMVPNFQPDIQ